MKSLYLLPLVLLLAGASPAVAQDVRYNFDKDANFAGFKTYKWVALKDAAKLNDLVDKQIKDAVDAELTKKGLTKSDADSANLYIGYQAGVGTRETIHLVRQRVGLRSRVGPRLVRRGRRRHDDRDDVHDLHRPAGARHVSGVRKVAGVARHRHARPWTPTPSPKSSRRTSPRPWRRC